MSKRKKRQYPVEANNAPTPLHVKQENGTRSYPDIASLIRFSYHVLFGITPFVMLMGTSELFEFNKMLFIYVMTIIIVSLWGFDQLMYKNRPAYPPWWATSSLLLFYITQVVSTVFSIDVHTSLYGYYSRFNGGLISITAYIILFFICIQYFSLHSVLPLLRTIIIASLLIVLWGIPGWFGYDLTCSEFTDAPRNTCWSGDFKPAVRMFSLLGQPNWLAAYLNITLFIGMYMFWTYLIELFKHPHSRKRMVWFLVYGSYCIVCFIGILLTRSRSGLIATAIGSIIFTTLMIVYAIRTRIVSLHRVVMGMGMIAVVFFLLVLGIKTGDPRVDSYLRLSSLPQREQAISDKAVDDDHSTSQPPNAHTLPEISNDSFIIRRIVWEGGLALAQKHPFVGTGLETYAYAYPAERPATHNYTVEWNFIYNKAHNEFIHYMATTGFIGFGAYMLMIGTMVFSLIFRTLRTSSNNTLYAPILYTGLIASYSTVLVTNFFGFSTTTVNLGFYILPAIAFMPGRVASTQGKRRLSFPMIFAMGFIIALSMMGFTWIQRYHYADRLYHLGTIYDEVNDYQMAALHYEKALQQRMEHVYQDRLAFALASLAQVVSTTDDIDQSLVEQLMEGAYMYNNYAIDASPQNVAYWRTRAKIAYLHYELTFDTAYLQQGIDALMQAHSLAPTDPTIPSSLALYHSLLYDVTSQLEQKQKHRDISLAHIRDAIELKKDYRENHVIYAQLLGKYDLNEEAYEQYAYIVNTFGLANDIADVWKELNEANP